MHTSGPLCLWSSELFRESFLECYPDCWRGKNDDKQIRRVLFIIVLQLCFVSCEWMMIKHRNLGIWSHCFQHILRLPSNNLFSSLTPYEEVSPPQQAPQFGHSTLKTLFFTWWHNEDPIDEVGPHLRIELLVMWRPYSHQNILKMDTVNRLVKSSNVRNILTSFSSSVVWVFCYFAGRRVPPIFILATHRNTSEREVIRQRSIFLSRSMKYSLESPK